MSAWIEVNGARIEKEFFEENVREARSCEWSEIRVSELRDHVHCMICGIAISPSLGTKHKLYKSNGGYLCSYCFDCFVK
jgi:hypothetical protein